MMGVIGIDADRARLAVVSHENGTYTWQTIERFDRNGRATKAYARALADLMGKASGRAVVYLEDTILVRRKNKPWNYDEPWFRVLSNVQGEILYEAMKHDVDVKLVAPTLWHRRILGIEKDRAKLKAAARDQARKDLGCCDLTEHESDAACICLYGLWEMRKEATAK